MYPWSSSYVPHGARSLHALFSLSPLLLARMETGEEGYDTMLEHSTRLEDSRFDSRSTCRAYYSCSPDQTGDPRARALTPRDRGERRVERSVEFDRDVTHGEPKLWKTLSSRPSSTFARFSHPPPSPAFPRQDLPLNQAPFPFPFISLRNKELRPTRSILLSHPLFFPPIQAFSLLTFFLASSFPEN